MGTMTKMSENYLDLTIDEVYDIITQGIDVWPCEFKSKDKKEFLESMIEYFVTKEEYEKCAIIQQIIERLSFDDKTN